jgi:hypothetical protein
LINRNFNYKNVDTEFSHAIIIFFVEWLKTLASFFIINFTYIKVHWSSHVVWHLDLKTLCEIWYHFITLFFCAAFILNRKWKYEVFFVFVLLWSYCWFKVKTIWKHAQIISFNVETYAKRVIIIFKYKSGLTCLLHALLWIVENICIVLGNACKRSMFWLCVECN